ncbi:cytochrome c [Massilia glaciei]|uniref:cytochrome c n=1 Tax=Massilia glaciei TaxID=1524097 RepID=UPI0026C73AEB|nr:cytochrome c [Massilia glaciei]
MKRTLLFVSSAVGLMLLAVLLFQHYWEPGSEQRAVRVADSAAQIRAGAYLARAGNCMTCHTTPDGAAYAGGRALATPFGKGFATNLTPENDTGIGGWSSDDFWRAMHNGKGKDGRSLYPVFPYPNFTKITRADSDARYAFLRTLAPVRQPNRAHELRFPYNQRGLLAFWRTLYFTPGEYQPDAAKDVEWNRGAYLVQGAGHCSACHSARDPLGGSLAGQRLDGATLGGQGWHASALGGKRDVAELAELLHTGVSSRAAVAGPMAGVVAASLQHLDAGDARAMASYLVSLPQLERGAAAAPGEITAPGRCCARGDVFTTSIVSLATAKTARAFPVFIRRWRARRG